MLLQVVIKFQNVFIKLEPSLSCSKKPTSVPYPDARERRKDEWFWRREMPQCSSPIHKKGDGIGISLFHRAFQFTIYNGPTNALACNKTLIEMSHTKTLKTTLTCFDHQMIIIRELLILVKITG
jgi:hypothetical protein